MKEIDMKNWYRKDFYELYSRPDIIPMFHIFTYIDITKAYAFAKKHDVSFYFTLSHIFHTALSSIEEFNIRVKNKKLVIEDCNIVNIICLEKGEKMFKIINVPYQPDILAFCKDAKRILKNQKTFMENPNGTILEYITCQPWIECQMTNIYSLDRDDFITKLSWDKIKTHKDGHKTANVTIGANHRVIDGLLIATALKKVQELINNLN